MNKKILSSFILIFFLIKGLSNCLGNELNTPRTTKVAISEIVNLGDSESEYLIVLIDMLKLRISLEKDIEVVNIDLQEQQELYTKNVSRPTENQKQDSELEYLISGYYKIVNNNIVLNLVLFNRFNSETIYFSPKPFSSKELFSAMDDLSNEIVFEIITGSQWVNTKLVGVMCVDVQQDADKELRNLIAGLKYLVHLNLPSRYTSISPKNIEQVCSSEDQLQEAKKVKIDILVYADFQLEDDELVIVPHFYLPELQESFSMNPYRTLYKGDNYEDYNDFSLYLNKGLVSILNEDLTWNTTVFTQNQNQQYSEIIEILEKNRINNSLSNYQSIELVQEAIEMKPNKPESYYYYALIQKDQKEFKKAIDNFNMAIERNKKFKDAYIEKGKLLSEYGDKYGALYTYLTSLKYLDDNYIKFLVGETYFFIDSVKKCIEYLEKVEDIEEYATAIDYYLGKAYNDVANKHFTEGDFVSAYKYASKSYDYMNNKFAPLSLMLLISNETRKFELGDSLINIGIHKEIIKPTYYLDHARDLRTKKDSANNFYKPAIRHAIKYLNRYTMEIEDPRALAYQMLGSSYFRLLELDTAVYYYNIAQEKEPRYIVHYLNLAEVAIMAGQYEIAQNKLIEALEMNFSNPQSRGFELIVHYLLYVNATIQHQAGDQYVADIKNLLDRKEYWYLAWSFDTFIKWLEQQTFSKEIKTDIQDITAKIIQSEVRK